MYAGHPRMYNLGGLSEDHMHSDLKGDLPYDKKKVMRGMVFEIFVQHLENTNIQPHFNKFSTLFFSQG